MIIRKFDIPYKLRSGRDYVSTVSATSTSASGASPTSPTGIVFMNDIEDVEITNLADAQFLRYDSALQKWVNTDANDLTRKANDEQITGRWWFNNTVDMNRLTIRDSSYNTIGAIEWVDSIRSLVFRTNYTGYEDSKIILQPGRGYSYRTEWDDYGNVSFRGDLNIADHLLKISGNPVLDYSNITATYAIGGNTISNMPLLTQSFTMGASAGTSAEGSTNIFIGRLAGRSYIGDNTIMIGPHAGSYATGSGNVFIGNYAGRYTNYTNTFLLEKNSSAYNLIRGDFDTGELWFNHVYISRRIESESYVSGILGSGTRWDFQAGGGLTFFEVDNMRVRNELRVHIFKKDIVKASNSYLFISDAAEIAEDTTIVDTNSTFKIVDDGTNATFDAGMLLWAKNIQDDGSLQVTGVQITVGNQVATGTTNGKDWIEYAVQSVRNPGSLNAGDTIVRVSGGYLLADASSQYSPFWDIYDGVNTWSDFQSADKLKARIGNLEGISDPEFGLISGYGIYTTNGYFKGKVVVTGGNAVTTGAMDDLKADLNTVFEFDQNLLDGKVVIENGKITADFLDADYIKSHIINTNYIEGLELDFEQGTIGGFIIEQNWIRHFLVENNDGRLIAMSNDKNSGYLDSHREGFSYFNTQNNEDVVKAVRMGRISKAGTNNHNDWSTNDYGFQIIYQDPYGNKEIFRVAQDGAKIGGINFDEGGLFTDNFSINADGSVNFTSGYIGGMYIGGVEDTDSDRFVLYPQDYLAFITGNNDKWAGIGNNVFPATSSWHSTSRFENKRTTFSGNIGSYYDVRNAGNQTGYWPNNYNIAIWVESGDIKVKQGNIRSYRDWYAQTLSDNIWALPFDIAQKFLIQTTSGSASYSQINLPNHTTISNALNTVIGQGTVWRFTIIIKMHQACQQNVRVYPPTGAYIYNYNGGTMAYQTLGAGDVLELLYDGGNWNLLRREQ